MKKLTALIIATTLSLGVITTHAVDEEKKGERQQRGEKQGKGQKRPGGRNPILAVLDTNRDGTLSAAEMQNAVSALQKLDKNGDGNLTQEELVPNRGNKGDREGKGQKGEKQGREGKQGKAGKQGKEKN